MPAVWQKRGCNSKSCCNGVAYAVGHQLALATACGSGPCFAPESGAGRAAVCHCGGQPAGQRPVPDALANRTRQPGAPAVADAGGTVMDTIVFLRSALQFLTAALLLAALTGVCGDQATWVAEQGSRLARTRFASGMWCASATTLLLITDTVRQLTKHKRWQLVLNLSVWIIPLFLLFSGQLSQLSLLKEYASREAVFDAALLRHLTLLVGTVLPALLIALPLGIALYRRPGWQSSVFGVLNVVQTVPSVALFGLLIAPLAALAKRVPLAGEWGISGIGMAPAIIALVFYALLPLVRNVVTGLQQVPPDVRETARGMGLSRRQQFLAVDVPWRCQCGWQDYVWWWCRRWAWR